MWKLYQPKQEGSANDPYMINKKGVKVQVPEGRVRDYLSMGFILVDKSWKPETAVQPQPLEIPRPLREIQKEASDKLDMLEVTEI